MRARKLASWLAGAAMVSLFVPSSSAEAQSDVTELVRHLEGAQERYQSRMKSVQGTVTGRFVSSKSGGKIQYKIASAWTVKHREGYGTFQDNSTTETFKPDGTIRSKTERAVFGSNSKYAFSLFGKDKDDGWGLKEVVLDPKAPLMPSRKRVNQEIDFLTSPHYWLEIGPLASVVASKDFKVMSITKTGDNLVQVKYHLTVKSKVKGRQDGEYRGDLVLDSRSWCIVSHDADFHSADGDKIHHIARYDVQTSAQGWSKITKAYEKAESNNGYRELTHDFQLEYDSAVDPHEFTLSAFGLPEPAGIVWPKPTRWWLWISLGAVGTVVFGFSFLKLRRRFQTPQPAPVTK